MMFNNIESVLWFCFYVKIKIKSIDSQLLCSDVIRLLGFDRLFFLILLSWCVNNSKFNLGILLVLKYLLHNWVFKSLTKFIFEILSSYLSLGEKPSFFSKILKTNKHHITGSSHMHAKYISVEEIANQLNFITSLLLAGICQNTYQSRRQCKNERYSFRKTNLHWPSSVMTEIITRNSACSCRSYIPSNLQISVT